VVLVEVFVTFEHTYVELEDTYTTLFDIELGADAEFFLVSSGVETFVEVSFAVAIAGVLLLGELSTDSPELL
jgi:hypothetical protein